MDHVDKPPRNDISQFVLDIERSLIGIDPRQELKLASLKTWSEVNELENSIASLNETIEVLAELRDYCGTKRAL